MSWGTGIPTDIANYGDADAWGGPADGIDLASQGEGTVAGGGYDYSADRWLFILMILSLVILWALGAGLFRSARM